MKDRAGELTPPLPCTTCRNLFPMEILAWNGGRCNCRPQCDAERADAQVRCTNCGEGFSVYYGDEGSILALGEWYGGDEPCQWHCQIWGDSADGMSILLPDDLVTAENQWLEDINNLLEADQYVFPIPKGTA